jgi:hypothetical protein
MPEQPSISEMLAEAADVLAEAQAACRREAPKEYVKLSMGVPAGHPEIDQALISSMEAHFPGATWFGDMIRLKTDGYRFKLTLTANMAVRFLTTALADFDQRFRYNDNLELTGSDREIAEELGLNLE